MRLRYAGICRLCDLELIAGTDAFYERNSKTVRCITCPTAVPDAGTAGASARREYERRKENREQRIRTDHPKLGGLILALSEDPQSTRAWQGGAIGEELVANRLTDLPITFRTLHDRRIPGTRGNIDHIVVGPSGVWVIDAKRYKGKRPELEVTGGIFKPRVESLRIGGRDGSKLVAGVHKQMDIVAAALDPLEDVPVIGALCILEADWPLIGGSFTANGVHVLWPRMLIKRITEAPSQSFDTEATWARLAAALPAA